MMISTAHGFKPHLVNGTNTTNAAAARYLASLNLNGSSDFASRAPGQSVQQQQQQQANQASQNAHKVAIQRLTASPQDARPFGERSDGSVPFVAPRAYHQAAQPAYPPNTAFSQLRPAAADSRAHMHLQFGAQTISPLKEAPTDQRRFSTGAHQWENADPSLVAALYTKFFDGSTSTGQRNDQRMSTGHVLHHGNQHVHQSYQRVSANRSAMQHRAMQQQPKRRYLPEAEELGPGWS